MPAPVVGRGGEREYLVEVSVQELGKQPHRSVKGANQRRRTTVAGSYDQQLVGMIGADQQRCPELLQENNEAVALPVAKCNRCL